MTLNNNNDNNNDNNNVKTVTFPIPAYSLPALFQSIQETKYLLTVL